ncbi:MAG: glycogen synthase, partial [bacterium]
MKAKLNIFFVSPEAFPFTKNSELAEVANSLPKFLKQLGHDVRVMMPNYKTINERKYVLRDVIRLQGLKFKIGDTVVSANGKSAFIPDSKVQIYFLDNKEFFDAEDSYLATSSNGHGKVRLEPYAFFSIGCLETLKLLHWQPDIIHCNNWQTALIPLLLKTVYLNDPFFKNSRTLFSVHNFSQQGDFDRAAAKGASFWESFGDSVRLSEGNPNILQVGLEYADMLNTVSESYASEALSHSENGSDLTKILKARKDEFFGISNRIDAHTWNPETDKLIPYNYTRNDLAGKLQNKRELLDRFGLVYAEDTPLLSMITPLSFDKGIDLFIEIVDDLMKMDLSIVISGTGEDKYHKELLAIQKRHKKRIGLDFTRDTSLIHLIEAGSDLFLMPSRLEPGGVNQLHSLAYGTIPIVRKTGALADT